MGEAKDRTALTLLALLLSLLGNLYLMQKMFVGRDEYAAELRGINGRLAKIESRIGLYAPLEAREP